MNEALKLSDWAPEIASVETYPNPSGIRPTEHKVLIEPMTVEEKTAGGIIRPDMNKDGEQFKQTKGRIVAVSPLAFSYARNDEWGDDKPKPGDLVLYARYAGINVKGPKDGKEYTLANDQDVCAVLEE